jgi:hypothetical protein
MKKTLIAAALAATAAITFSAPANAYVVDTFIKSANLKSSGDAVELGFAELSANANLTLDAKTDVTASNVMTNPGTTDQHYLDVVSDQPGYFLLKFGTGGTGVTDNFYFFQNTGELTKLVWSDSQVNNLTANFGNFNTGRLSHFTTFNGGQTPVTDEKSVPEPTSLLLFGLGIAALSFTQMRRR